MKKSTKLFSIILVLGMILGVFMALGITASAAKTETVGPFAVTVTDLVYTNDGSSVSSGASFDSISYKVVNSTTIQFKYAVWLREGASGASIKSDVQTATLNNYSCTEDINVKIPITCSVGPRNWTYNLSVTKAAGHVYDNSCDTGCNICGATRTITHAYKNGVCTICGDVCAHTAVDGTGLCTNCKSQVVASVTINGEASYYLDFQSAIDAAKAQTTNSSTLTLLANDLVLNDIEIKTNCTFTLDLNGHTIKSADDFEYFLFIYSGHVTLTDSSEDKAGAVLPNAKGKTTVALNGGTLTIIDGNWGEVYSYSGTTTINGGTFGLFYSDGGSVVINGGEFAEIRGNGNKVFDFLSKDGFYYDEDGALVTTVDATTLENVTVKQGADLSYGEVTLEYSETPYTALAKKPTVVVTILGKTIDPANYDIAYTDNVALGTAATATVTGKGVYTGTQSATFTIKEGTLTVDNAPVATYEYGDTYVGKTITGGKVVITGNTSVVITGTWTWVEGTGTATFTPDSRYDGLFETLEAYTVRKNVTAATPVLTLTSPSPSMGPGQSIQMSVVAQNPNDAELTDLPTSFKITYKIGENGTPVTVDGLKFTLPSDVTLGETVYVWVENVAVSSKYTVGKSNELALKVGQVDYSADIDKVQENLDDAVADLQALIDAKADKTALEAAQATLEQAIEDAQAAAEQAAKDGDTALETKLTKAIDEAKTEITEAYTKAIDEAKTELTTLINTKADQTALNAAVDELKGLITAAEQAAIDGDAALKEELTQAITDAKAELVKADEQLQANINAAIQKAADELEAVRADLQSKIDANDQRITDEVKTLNETIENTKKLLEEADAKNRKELEEALAKAEETLNAAIKQVADDLEAARKDLQSKIDKNAETIETEVARLDELVETTREVLEAADAKNRAELEAALAEAEATLKKSIESVSNRLNNTQKVLLNVINAGDKQLDEKITALNTALSEAIALLDTKTVDADAALKAELLATIEAADKALDEAIKAVQKNLDDAKAELAKAIADGDSALTEKLSALDAALKSAEAALKAADETNKTELLAAIEKTEADLTKLITEGDKQNADALASAMVLLRAEMEQAKKDAQLVPTILVIIALAGDVVLAAWLIISKKKRS